MNEAYNIDCLDYMRTLPDNAFDLACVDPPYGDAMQKWEKREQGAHYVGRCRQKRYAEAYESESCSQSVQVERERERSGITASETTEADLNDTSVTRTGGTWAAKYGKKS